MTYLKKVVRIKSLNSIQNSLQQDQKSVAVFVLSSSKQVLIHTITSTPSFPCVMKLSLCKSNS